MHRVSSESSKAEEASLSYRKVKDIEGKEREEWKPQESVHSEVKNDASLMFPALYAEEDIGEKEKPETAVKQ